MRRWSEQERDTLRALRARGLPDKQTAAHLGRSVGSIREQVVYLGIAHRRAPRLDDTERDVIRRLYLAGKSDTAIAGLLERSRFAVWSARMSMNVPSRGVQRPWVDAEREKLRELYLAGTHLRQIASELRRAMAPIIRERIAMGLPDRPRRTAPKYPHHDEAIKAMRLIEGLTFHAIGRRLGRSLGSIAGRWHRSLREGRIDG